MGASSSHDQLLMTNELLEFQKASTFNQSEIQSIFDFFQLIRSSHINDGFIDYNEFCFSIGLGFKYNQIPLPDQNAELRERFEYRKQVIKSSSFNRFKNCKLIKNLYSIFDRNQDNKINFREFLLGFALFQNETFKKQIFYAFKIFDPQEKGYVTVQELKEYLKEAIYLLGDLSEKQFPQEILDAIIEETLLQALSLDDQSNRNSYDILKQESIQKVNKSQNTSAQQKEDLNNSKLTQNVITFNQFEMMAYKNPEMIQWLKIDIEKLQRNAFLIKIGEAELKNCF